MVSKILYKMIRLLILIALLTNSIQVVSQNLDDFRWKNRIVLIMNPGPQNPLSDKQLKSFRLYKAEIKERDLLVFEVNNTSVTDIFEAQRSLDPAEIPHRNYEGIILLGKDGGIKLKKPFYVPPSELFELIDSMPMRRAEMKSSVKN